MKGGNYRDPRPVQMAALGHQQLSQVSQIPGQLGSYPLAAE